MSFFEKDRVLVIAEAGKNFIINERPRGSMILDEAKNLARVAKESGADAVKYQTHVFEDEGPRRDPVRHEWIKKNEQLTPYDKFWKPLKEYCDSIGILFMTTPMSPLAAAKIQDLVTVWKVGSGNTTDWELLKFLIETKKPIILSTGMSTAEEVEQAYNFLYTAAADFALTHCTSIYPCPVNKLNLNVMRHWLNNYNVPIGLSDHSLSVTIPSLAVQLGATIIEKHFTIDKGSWGPDHKISLEASEFQEMVEYVREAEETLYAYGVSLKTVLPEEEESRKKFRL